LNLLVTPVPLRGHRRDELAVLVDDPHADVGEVDRDGLARVSHPDLDALTGDLGAMRMVS
jgi:hypothetical protein